MNRLVALVFILFSAAAYAGTSGSFDDAQVLTSPTARVSTPAVKKPAPQVKSEPVKPAEASKPDNDDDDEDEDEEEGAPAPLPKRRGSGLLSPSRAKTSGGSIDVESEGTYCKYCGRATEAARDKIVVRYRSITAPQDVLNSSVWPTFKRNFEACAPGCQPIGLQSFRDRRIRPKPSCHHSSAAIDVFGMRCGGSTYTASRETARGAVGKFSDVVRCMKRKGMYLIYNASDHYDHAHLSLGCWIGPRQWMY